MTNFTTGTAGINLITSFEGFRSEPYLDQAGIPTIGYGSTHYQDGTPVTMDDSPITQEQAIQLLQIYLQKFETVINNAVTSDINQSQFDALCDFVYNEGPGHFLSSTLLKVVNGESDVSISDAFLMWDKVEGQVNPGLVRRRNAEIALYNS